MDNHVGPMPRLIWNGVGWRPDRRSDDQGRLGRRRTDSWLPYSAPFVAQALAQRGGGKAIYPTSCDGRPIRPIPRRLTDA